MAPSAADQLGRAAPVPSDADRRTRRLGFVAITAVAFALEIALWGFDPTLRDGTRPPAAMVVVIVAGAFVVLLARRQHPLLVFGVVWAYSVGMGLLVPTMQPFTAMVLALYETARHESGGRSAGLLAASLVLVPVNTLDTVSALVETPAQVVLTGAIWLVIFGLTYAAARLNLRAERNAERALVYLASEAALAAQTERLRIARDLHDVIAHSVTAMVLNAAGTRAQPSADRAALLRTLELVEDTGARAMVELRTLLGLLHTGEAAGPPGHGLADLDELVSDTRACGVDLCVIREGQDWSLSPSTDEAGYRVVQEMLTNVAKHGGPRTRAVLTIRWSDDGLDLTVDNTVAVDPDGSVLPPSGLGLDGMRRRVHELDGEVVVSRPTDGSFRCQVRLPAAAAALAVRL